MVGGFVIHVPYRSHRPSLESSFGPSSRAVNLGTTSIFDLELADNELEWFFWKGLGQLSTMTRPDENSAWSAPRDLGIDGFSPSLSADGLTLYFITLEGALNASCRKAINTPWQPPVSIGIAAAFRIASIDISVDGLSLVITGDTESLSAGVYLSNRTNLSSPFAEPIAIESLRGGYQNARFSSNDREIVVSAEYGGNHELFITERH